MAAGAQLEKAKVTTDLESQEAHSRPGAGASASPRRGSFPSSLNQAWSKIAESWSALSNGQRSWTIGSTALLFATIAAIIWFASRTDWKTLYAGIDPEDARQIGGVLTQAQIPYQLQESGSLIEVPAGFLDKARLTTAAKGGPRSGRMGFELFDKPNWVGSEFDEQVNYQRALEGELEHTIATLSDVQSARVHLVMPHDSLFRDQQRPAKAAVVLTLRHRELASGEDESIRNLVSSAVDGLKPDQVSLIDSSGHQPLGPKTGDALRLGLEQALEAKLIETLEAVTGAGNVRASVSVDYDPTATEVTEETYDPDQSATLSMQRTEQTSGPQSVPAGVPGTASNAPNAQTPPVYPQQTTPPQTAKSESGTYGVSRKVRHLTQGPGHIRRLTAAILVNDRYSGTPQKGKQATWSPRSADELRLLTSLAQAAVGFDTARGDTVTVEDISFDENHNAAVMSPVKQMQDAVEHSPVLVKYVASLTGLLLIILLALRPAIKRTGQRTPLKSGSKMGELTAGGEVKSSAASAQQGPFDLERARSQQVFDQVSEQLMRDPAQSSRLLQSWIHSE